MSASLCSLTMVDPNRQSATRSSKDTEYLRGSPSVSPWDATISGDGVSPAANAAASGSPPGSSAITESAFAGRFNGSGSRQRRMAFSTPGIDVGGDGGHAGEAGRLPAAPSGPGAFFAS